jgi:F-type H+-transporting ATPase subunit alpha
LVELLKQDQYAPFDVIDQSVAILIATKGYFDVVPTAKIRLAEKDVLEFFHSRHGDLMAELKTAREISGGNEAKILEAVKAFLATKKY